MGAFHLSDHSGMVSFLGGMSLLVLIAVGSSVLLEDQLGPDRKMTLLETETALMEGRARIRAARSSIAELETKKILLQKKEESLASIPRLKEDLLQRDDLQNQLDDEAQSLRSDIEEIQDTWLSYRQRRRKIVRRKMIGSSMSQFVLVNGRVYENVVIREIQSAGISIQHVGGTARILTKDIPEDLRLNLDLDLDEATAAIQKERNFEKRRRELISKAVTARQKAEADALNPALNPELAAKQLLSAKAKVDDLLRRMYTAQGEASRARSNDAFSSKRSVPLSLETWADRAKRMERAASNYRVQFDRAVRKVKRLDPNYRPPHLD